MDRLCKVKGRLEQVTELQRTLRKNGENDTAAEEKLEELRSHWKSTQQIHHVFLSNARIGSESYCSETTFNLRVPLQ